MTLWAVAHQAPLSVGFFRQEYWSELPFPSSGDLPEPGIEHASPVSRIAGRFFTHRAIREDFKSLRRLKEDFKLL